jgi:hypothetical protein
VVGFVSLPDEHAPSVKYRVRRVPFTLRGPTQSNHHGQHPVRQEVAMVVDFNPCSAGTRSCVRPSHRDLHLLPDWVLMVVGFAGRSDIPPNNLDRSIPSAV